MPFRRFRAALALAALAAAFPAVARSQTLPPAAPADAEAMLALMRQSADGWNEASLAKHVSLYVDSVTFMTRQGPRPGKDQVVASFTDIYFRDGKPIQALSFSEIVIRALGTDNALMTGRFHLTGGDRADQTGWFTLVWTRTTAGWRVVHDHSS